METYFEILKTSPFEIDFKNQYKKHNAIYVLLANATKCLNAIEKPNIQDYI